MRYMSFMLTTQHRDLGDYVHGVADVQKLIKSLGSVSRETDEYAGIEQIVEEGSEE